MNMISNMFKLTSCRCFNPVIGIWRYAYQDASCNSIETDEFYEDDIFTNIPNYVGSNHSDIQFYKQVMAEFEIYSKSSEMTKLLINKNKWQDLLMAQNIIEREYLYRHWRNIESSKKKSNKKKYNEKIGEEKKWPLPGNSLLTNVLPPYTVRANSVFPRLSQEKMRTFFEYQLILKMIFGPHLIIDCGYESYMNIYEIKYCYRQIKLLWKDNFYSKTPFNIMFCNMAHDSTLLRKLNTHYHGHITKPESIFGYSEKSYLDFFKREELIYLSPHSDITLDQYDNNHTYIIGAFVDLCKPNEFSKEKAKIDGIKTAKLPIFDYLDINEGSDLLPINQVADILRQVRNGISWSEAMKCISNKKWTINPFTIKSERTDKMYDTKNIKKFYKQKKNLECVIPSLQ